MTSKEKRAFRDQSDMNKMSGKLAAIIGFFAGIWIIFG